ncbi:MAG: hypothetical protein WAN50_04875 [Minisyncoccia bacterium]
MNFEELGGKPKEPRENNVGEETFSYTPFDAYKELRELSLFSSDEDRLSSQEKRELKQQRLKELKENLAQQQVGIAAIIQSLRNTIESNPDTPTELLMRTVRQSAPKLRLNQFQLDNIAHVLHQYEARHRQVETWRAQYPDDADLFEAYFGKKPVGRIRIVKLPMTLHFECYSLEDYAFAYHRKGNVSEPLTDEEIQSAGLSGGAALFGSIATIENVCEDLEEEIPVVFKTKISKGATRSLRLHEELEDVRVSVEGLGSWTLEILERDGNYFPKHMRLKNPEGGTVFDVRSVNAPQGPGKIYVYPPKIFEDANEPHGKHTELSGDLVTNGKVWGSYHIENDSLQLNGFSEGLVLEHTMLQERSLAKFPETGSIRVLKHEEQHAINQLLEPIEGFF